jgi:uncharacterized membrane protein SpoIIM required for sporulation
MVMRKAIGWLGVAIIVGVFIAGFIAYFISSFDPPTKISYDGFGRQLCESPWFMRLIFGQNRLWVGWVWFIGDMIIFWAGIGLGASLAGWGLNKKV